MTAARDLVIMDCDGVLVDSEPIANRILCELLAECGLHMSIDDTIRTFMGRSMPACIAIAEERLGHTLPPDFAERHREKCREAFAAELRPVPGVVEALDAIALPVCVASSSGHARLRDTLSAVGLLSRFEGRIFSADDVANGKPAPDVFLYAAERMRARPGRCVVVEDTVIGVQAGVAAGMTVFGYAALTPASALQRAGAIPFTRMSELPMLLERISGR